MAARKPPFIMATRHRMIPKEQQFSRLELEQARDAIYVIQKVADKRLAHAPDWNDSHMEECRKLSILLTQARDSLSMVQHDCEYR